MLVFKSPIPLSLYIHLPWCIRKCPYCDFNSHRAPTALPEDAYINALIQDLQQELPRIWGRRLTSIFIGGGTPSLFSAASIERLLQTIYAVLPFPDTLEITLEANPGTFEQAKFKDFRSMGVNRLSIGVQSFQEDKLKQLGRVHNGTEAARAIEIARSAGFTNFNIDLMHGLPNQSKADALYDLTKAFSFNPPHVSWYQLTIEPNTVFAKHPPTLPKEEVLWDIQYTGEQLLAEHGFEQYEISAYAKPEHRCTHNVNYWQYGDYLGIGAGAHSKITDVSAGTITRLVKTRNPSDYLNPQKEFTAEETIVPESEIPFEFMMNALRLKDGVSQSLFEERAGIPLASIQTELLRAQAKKLLERKSTVIKPTDLGRRFLNDLLGIFLR